MGSLRRALFSLKRLSKRSDIRANLSCMPSYLDNLSFFSTVIVARGREYFRSGRVLSFTHNGNKVDAIVEGSDENYQVHLSFSKDGYTLLSADCSCPYYDDCKHEVAVLYALEEERLHSKGSASFSLTAESFLERLEAWSQGTNRNRRYDLFIRDLTLLLKDPDTKDKEGLLVRSFAEIEYGLYLHSSSAIDVFGCALLSFLELLPLVKMDADSFVLKTLSYVQEEKLPIKNILFSTFLGNVRFAPSAVSYFLDVYKANKTQANTLLNNVHGPLKESFSWDIEFLKIVAILKPNLLLESQFEVLFSEASVLEDKKTLLNVLRTCSRLSKRPRSFYSFLERVLSLLHKEELIELFKSLFASGIDIHDACFLLTHLSKEDAALGFSKVPYLKFYPIYSTVVFYCYPIFGEYSTKELHPYFLWLIRNALNDKQKEIAFQASSLLLEKKRFASHEPDVYAAFYWLADFHTMNALALAKEKRFETYFNSNSNTGKAMLLYLESVLLPREKRPFVLYQGDPYVSL